MEVLSIISASISLLVFTFGVMPSLVLSIHSLAFVGFFQCYLSGRVTKSYWFQFSIFLTELSGKKYSTKKVGECDFIFEEVPYKQGYTSFTTSLISYTYC